MNKFFYLVFLIAAGGFVLGGDLDLSKITKKPELGDALDLPIRQQRLFFKQQFGKIYYIPLSLKGRTSIEILITEGSDNTGDKGMTWKLMDSALKETYASGFAKRKQRQKWMVKDIKTLNPVLVLEDEDAKFTGNKAGNGFNIEIRFPN